MAARRKKPATPVEPPKAEVSGTLVAVIGAALLAGGFLAGRFTVPQPDVAPAPDGKLAALVPAEARPHLSAFFSDFSRVVEAGNCKTTGQFRDAYRVGVGALQGTLDAKGWSEIDEPISDRIAKAVGLDDVELAAEKRSKLATSLKSIAQEFDQ